MNDYQRRWWEQARSDHKVLVLLRRKGADPCHQLHYLQMITEKLAKAYLWRSGNAPRRSHVGFGMLMRLLQQVPQDERQQIADIFEFKRFKDFQGWARANLPLIYEVERLAPALANDGPNPEYPWPHDAPQQAPATYEFDVWDQ
ncbi:MAG: hypothetical protein N2C14_30810 [Planctomycetales bacterium]